MENSGLVKCGENRGDKRFDFIVVIPRNFRSVYDQMTCLGKLYDTFNPLEISDISLCPDHPYCLYDIDPGLSELTSSRRTIAELNGEIAKRDRFGLTDVEIIALALHFPELRQYQIFGTGSRTNKGAYPFIKTDRKNHSEMQTAGDNFSGFSPVNRTIIIPSCLSRSL